MPNQQGGSAPGAPASTIAKVTADDGERTVLGPAKPRPVTITSSYNRLAEVPV
jgi:hypothetical protein